MGIPFVHMFLDAVHDLQHGHYFSGIFGVGFTLIGAIIFYGILILTVMHLFQKYAGVIGGAGIAYVMYRLLPHTLLYYILEGMLAFMVFSFIYVNGVKGVASVYQNFFKRLLHVLWYGLRVAPGVQYIERKLYPSLRSRGWFDKEGVKQEQPKQRSYQSRSEQQPSYAETATAQQDDSLKSEFDSLKSTISPVRFTRNLRAFDKLIGVDSAIIAIKDALEFPILYPDRMEKYGIKPASGLLLHGAPGTGKTALARATAEYFGLPFYVINASELIAPLSGLAEQSLRKVFADAKKEKGGAVIFFDEIDAIGQRRDGQSMNRGSDTLLTPLLTLLDGFDHRNGVYVMAGTNRKDVLDEALLRAGRFDRHVEMKLPDIHGRVKLFEHYLKGKPVKNVDLRVLAAQTDGKSPADIEAIVSKMALQAAKREVYSGTKDGITTADFFSALR